ncbi:unnamed protein product [Bursaphelenchus okinawaensis]|uniref:Integrase catalytic domain-containing protein n=1 Tax=Bursaphelenchus okinawaensis TaxID=465554 RepID=A0A811KYS0_9BILA|nr:unnamed protein product [Bursaphelenchus okinawaensis]CAG9114737.1 unnamed protein product [Bursaphelenchus okinawaensis]
MVDSFTRFVTTQPIPNKTSSTVANAFLNSYITVYGIPETIVSDQGTEFTGNPFQQLCAQMGIEHKTTTPYNPQADGTVERQNKTLCAMLSSYLSRGGTNWDEFIKLISFAYNTTPNPVLKFSPYFILFGREALTPVQQEVYRNLPSIYVDMPTYTQKLAEHVKQAWTLVQEVSELDKVEIKKHADKSNSAKPHNFAEGDLVLRVKEVRDHKFDTKYIGPYKVVRVTNPNITLEDPQTKRQFSMHVNKCKKFFPEPEAKLQDANDRDLPSSDEDNASVHSTYNARTPRTTLKGTERQHVPKRPGTRAYAKFYQNNKFE